MRLALFPLIACAACSASATNVATPTSDEPLHVVVGTTGPVSIAGTPVTDATFAATAKDALQKHRIALIDADGNVPFRVVANAADVLKRAGAVRVSTGAIIGGGASAGTPTAPPAVPHAEVAEASRWDCTFPNGAKKDASVLVKVLVAPDGKAAKVDVLEDPGHGFAKAAQTCAMAKTYRPAKDPSGASMEAATFPFYVQFVTR